MYIIYIYIYIYIYIIIVIAWMLNRCKNNTIHCKTNDICIA